MVNKVLTRKKKSKKKLLKYFYKEKELYFFLLPAIILLFIFNYSPMWGIIMGFQDFDIRNGIWGSPFVGLKNFMNLFTTPEFPRHLRNTIGLNFFGFLGFPLPIILAILLSEYRYLKFKRFVQTVSYLPHFISWIVVGGIVYTILNYDTGAVPYFFAKLGLPKPDFLVAPKLFWPMAVTVAIWKEIGWGSIIYLAAIAGINPELYESALVDGANRIQRIWYITLPSIMPIIALFLILEAGQLVGGGGGIAPGFEGVFNLRNPILAEYSDILTYWVYKEGLLRANYSFATATGFLLSVVNFTLVIFANKIANRIRGMGFI